MRTLIAALTLLLIASITPAQIDPATQAMQAAQAAAQQSQQATLQAMQQAQQANQQAADAARQAMLDTMNAANQSQTPYFIRVATPKFSVKPGTLASPTTIKITDSTRGAIIYYTTDGWTPTVASKRYLGPVPIDSTTTLQALAIVPGFGRSFIASAQYTLNSTSLAPISTPQPPSLSSGASSLPAGDRLVVPKGTPVPLVFASNVTSHAASVGDAIPMALAEGLTFDGVLLARKGTPAVATVIQVDKNGAGGLPGMLSFQMESLDLNGLPIKLVGGAAREGEPRLPNVEVFIPVVGPFFAFKHGTEAIIKQGTPYTASIAADTTFPEPN